MEVHRCRFVDYVPSAANALAFAPNTTRPILACGRANGDIELWNPKHDWTLEKVIPGGKNTSVEAIAWAHQTVLTEDEDFWDSEKEKQAAIKKLTKTPPRLFSAGLNAVVTEWDLTSLKPKRSVDSHGGAVWCMATNNANTVLAVGCEDGCVRLFDIADGEFAFIRSFDKQRTRILSLAWSQDDKIMVTGSANSSIYKWDVEQGRVATRMTVERVPGEDTLVWSVKILSTGDIVSGDSLGHVKIWDGTTTTMIQSFNSHGADVLCLAVGRDGTTVFSSGVDRKCNQYRLVDQPAPKKTGKNGTTHGKTEMVNKWVLSATRRFHSHDVRAMAMDESRNVDALVTGGVDVSLVVCSASQFTDINQRRISYVPQRPVISMSKSTRLMLCRQANGIKVWRLGKSASPIQPFSDFEIGAHMDLIEPQQAVLEMNFRDDRNLTSSAMSEDGHWIAVADIEEVKLFRIDENPSLPGQLIVKKQKSFPGVRGTGAHFLAFTPDNSRLVVASTDSTVVIVGISQWESKKFDVLAKFSQHRGVGGKVAGSMDVDGEEQEVSGGDGHVETIISMAVSADGQWLATGDVKNRIFVFNLDTVQHHATLPTFDAPLTALHFHPSSPVLVIPTASNVFYVFNVETRLMSDWSREYSSDKAFPTKFLAFRDKIQGVAFNPARKNTLMVWGAKYMCHVDLTLGVGDRNAALSVGKRKRDEMIEAEKRKQQRERRMMKYAENGVLSAPDMENGEAVVVLEKNGKKVRKVLTDDFMENQEAEVNFQVIHKFQPLMFVDFLDDNSLVVVELPFIKILSTLPPSYYRASYGTNRTSMEHGEHRSCAYGLRHQARCLSAIKSTDGKSSFIIGTQELSRPNEVHLLTFDEEFFEISTTIFNHPHEIWDISASKEDPDLFFTCYREVIWQDKTEVISVEDWRICIWDIDIKQGTAKLTGSIDTPDKGFKFTSAVMNPHAQEVVAVYGRSIQGWNLSSLKPTFTIKDAQPALLFCVDYNPNRPFQIATGGDDCKVRIWDVRDITAGPIMTIQDHTHWVWSVAYNKFHDQLMLTSSSDCQVNLQSIVSISTGAEYKYEGDASEGEQGAEEDGEQGDNVQDPPTDGLVQAFDQHEDSVYQVAWSSVDPWLFMSLSHDGRAVMNQVPSEEKFKILLNY
ncbi:U3 small nucleolar RNA-associated protein [Linnemannia hyalina]|uniref:U3 small nucleolar RNA-associated protein n=1 Tax=Linnemannia hyalina TaxID=64524 RepID=A0A9P7Y1E8_9FUNG|nr:U3 small nucleolar RNA-associated protein [Linnemannia hyalina]